VRSVAATDQTTSIAVAPTAIAAATQHVRDPNATLGADVLREAVRERRTGSLIVLAVDTSSSMGADRRIAFAKAAALGLLTDAYQRRDRVAVVAFRGDDAETVVRPTGSVEIARRRLAELPVGGTTPLAAALDAAARVAEQGRADGFEPVVVLVTDGRATAGGADPLAAAREAAQRVVAAAIAALVVDSELASPRLGLAAELARDLHAECVRLEHLGDGALREHLRALTGS
jgi:magnesium chelatase subunit D